MPAASLILSTNLHRLPAHLVAEPSSPVDLATQSSHHSTQAPPSLTMSQYCHCTPSPTHHCNPYHTMQATQDQQIHSQGSISPRPCSWPLVGYPQPQYMQYTSPLTSWSGHQFSGSWGSQQPLLQSNSNNPPSSIPSPLQPVHHPRFYFHRSTGNMAGPFSIEVARSGTWSPPPPRPPRWSPPCPLTHASPPLEPPRCLTVTNPSTYSPTASETSLPHTPQKEQPA